MSTKHKYTKAQAEKYINEKLKLTIDDYLQWCKDRNLKVTLEKTDYEFSRECDLRRSEVALAVLEKRRKCPKNNRDVLQLLCDNPLADVGGKYSQIVYNMPHDLSDRGLFMQLVDAAHNNHTKILDDEKSVFLLLRIAKWHMYYVRDVQSWRPNSHNLHKQKSSLIRHLFAKYPMPAFMDSVWDRDDLLWQEWYIHMGAGNNIRTARHLKFPFTKKMAHHFLEAPDNFSVLEAFMHGMVVSYGGTVRVSQALRGTRILEFKEDFRESFIRFLIANPMLDTNQYGPIMDYVNNIKYVGRVQYENGHPTTLPPPQPNFNMTGRSVDTLLKQVERWHKELNKSTKSKKLSWAHSNINDFFLEEGETGSQSHRTWSIVELLNSSELLSEGRAMRHCVYSYTSSCASGKCSIWSLRRRDQTGSWILVTIEVSHGTIVQARGLSQRKPTTQEWRVIKLWAQRNKIAIAQYA